MNSKINSTNSNFDQTENETTKKKSRSDDKQDWITLMDDDDGFNSIF